MEGHGIAGFRIYEITFSVVNAESAISVSGIAEKSHCY